MSRWLDTPAFCLKKFFFGIFSLNHLHKCELISEGMHPKLQLKHRKSSRKVLGNLQNIFPARKAHKYTASLPNCKSQRVQSTKETVKMEKLKRKPTLGSCSIGVPWQKGAFHIKQLAKQKIIGESIDVVVSSQK